MNRTITEELARDLDMLDACELSDAPAFRTWVSRHTAVVLGLSQRAESEVLLDECARRAVAVLRRPSGGGAVVIGPGTLQYTFALPYSLDTDLTSIAGSKRFCNRVLRAALDRMDLGEDQSGDLILDGRKVGGVALKRRRRAMLLHGTLLTEMHASEIGCLLRHPTREPAYRQGRSHDEFLGTFGPIDALALTRRVRAELRRVRPPRTDAEAS